MSAYQSAKQKTESAKQAKPVKPQNITNPKVNTNQMMAAPETMRPEEVLTAQQQLGNQVVQRALDDKEQSKKMTDQHGNLRGDISSSIQQARGSGFTLPKEVQTEMKQKFGQDFAHVRLHNDNSSDKLSRSINARAFTIGSDIFFKSGVYAPSSEKGRETLIHELTHVVQQSRSKTTGGNLKLGAPNTTQEKEADHVGKQNSRAVAGASSGAIQRVSEEEEEMLQGQPEDEEEIQMQSMEEEEIQTQGEEEEVQMQSEEEEIQMQSEEEEVQMQPDSGNVVQRVLPDWLKRKKKEPVIPRPTISVDEINEQRTKMGLTKESSVRKKLHHNLNLKGADERSAPKIRKVKPVVRPKLDEINQKRKAMGLSEDSSAESKKKLQSSLSDVAETQQHKFKQNVSGFTGGQKFTQVSQREKLVHTLKNPNSTAKERQKAEEQLRTFHKSGTFKKNPATIALEERKKMLKEKAKAGDEKAAALYKKENPSFGTKVMGFASKAQSFYGKHKDTIGTVMGFLGIGGGKDKDKKEEAKGGGGDGGYAVIISQLMQENKMLKEKLADKG